MTLAQPAMNARLRDARRSGAEGQRAGSKRWPGWRMRFFIGPQDWLTRVRIGKQEIGPQDSQTTDDRLWCHRSRFVAVVLVLCICISLFPSGTPHPLRLRANHPCRRRERTLDWAKPGRGTRSPPRFQCLNHESRYDWRNLVTPPALVNDEQAFFAEKRRESASHIHVGLGFLPWPGIHGRWFLAVLCGIRLGESCVRSRMDRRWLRRCASIPRMLLRRAKGPRVVSAVH